MPNLYELGDLITCTCTFADSDGDVHDPSAVFFKAKAPDGTTIEYQYTVDGELEKVSVGVYRVNVSASQTGWWYVRFYSTGDGQAADEDKFGVKESEFD